MQVDGMASHLRCDLAESAGPGDMVKIVDGLTQLNQMWKPRLKWPLGPCTLI